MAAPPLSLRGDQVEIRPYGPEDVDDLLGLRLENRTFLEPLEPARPDSFYSREGQSAFIDTAAKDVDLILDTARRDKGLGSGPQLLLRGLPARYRRPRRPRLDI